MAGFDDSSYERLYQYANPNLTHSYDSHKAKHPSGPDHNGHPHQEHSPHDRHHHHDHHHDHHDHHRPSSPLTDKIAKAIVDEFQAVQFYTRLAELAPTMEARQIIRDILAEERRDHYRTFVDIYRSLTNRQPKVSAGPLPATYAAGLQMAIRDELQSVANYQAISEMATDPYISKVFSSAAMDEQRHASWLLYLWMRLITTP
ncbi:ferritin-like domain-containing protein [Heliorestis acidaminivorans]|uniref:Ferritin-like domain-containing protein n=1 Tax=Heliorestis acidaminivorans TaxID=553427 RepID=A0A6I0F5V9_9FIRM|nr:ferritin-like domain-containing protein [Heliorestis acidaminivorans]KAB2952669.1 ferritin-like domain-containing protein [Heliorestis acidaminivorans]